MNLFGLDVMQLAGMLVCTQYPKIIKIYL